MPLNDISKLWGVPLSVLHACTKGDKRGETGWEYQRMALEGNFLEALTKKKSDDVDKIVGLTLHILKEQLMRIHQRGIELSVDQIERLGGLGLNTQKLWNLKELKPTEIHAHMEFSREQVSNLIKELQEEDPYVDYKEVEKERSVTIEYKPFFSYPEANGRTEKDDGGESSAVQAETLSAKQEVES